MLHTALYMDISNASNSSVFIWTLTQTAYSVRERMCTNAQQMPVVSDCHLSMWYTQTPANIRTIKNMEVYDDFVPRTAQSNGQENSAWRLRMTVNVGTLRNRRDCMEVKILQQKSSAQGNHFREIRRSYVRSLRHILSMINRTVFCIISVRDAKSS